MNATATKRSTNTVTAPRINRRKYAHLLAEVLPTTITNDTELERLTAIVDKLSVKSRLSVEETRLLDLLATLIEVYENEHHEISDAPPHVMIQGFMQERGLRNKDLEPVLGSSGVTSEVISGKRKLSKTQIKKLAEFFAVTPDLFTPSMLS